MTTSHETGRSILLVEDNPDDEELTVRALRQNKLANDIVVARDGEHAMELLFEPGAEARPLPDLVLLDLKLPKVPGLEVLRRIRAEPRTELLPVVILTSSDEDRDVIDGYAIGVNSYVRKPVDFDRFVDAVGDLGLYWLVTNYPPTWAVAGGDDDA